MSSSPAPAPPLPFCHILSALVLLLFFFFFFNSGSPPSTHLPFLLCPFPLLLISLLVFFFFLSYFHLLLCSFLFREYTSCLQYVSSLILSFHSLSSPSFPPTVPFSLYTIFTSFFQSRKPVSCNLFSQLLSPFLFVLTSCSSSSSLYPFCYTLFTSFFFFIFGWFEAGGLWSTS